MEGESAKTAEETKEFGNIISGKDIAQQVHDSLKNDVIQLKGNWLL